MAGESDCESESGAKDGKTPGFQCCVKKKCNVCVCINCSAIYHNSCVKRMGKIKRIIDETKIVCCTSEDWAGNDKIESKLFEIEKAKMSIEIEYLKKLLNESADKNNILKQNNGLLIERIANLENQNGMHKHYKQSFPPPINSPRQAAPNTPTPTVNLKLDVSPAIQGHKGVASNGKTYAGKAAARPNHVATPQPTQQKDKEESDNNENNLNQNINIDDGFQFQREQRKKQYKKKQLGNAKISPENEKYGFAGGDRKAWIYLNRIKRQTTEEMIIDYVKKKPGFEDENIMVKELPSDANKLKCFVLTAPLNRKDELYDQNFWPLQVGIKRFIFAKHKDFLDNGASFF